MKMNEVKEFYEEHKALILGTLATVTAVGVGVVFHHKIHGANKLTEVVTDTAKQLPELAVGEFIDAPWNENGHTTAIVDKVTIDQLGAFGQAMKNVVSVNDDTMSSMVIAFDDVYANKF